MRLVIHQHPTISSDLMVEADASLSSGDQLLAWMKLPPAA
jgi:hypothetical protein